MFRNACGFEKTKKYIYIRKDSCVVLPTSCVKEILVPNYIILFMKYILIDDEEKERWFSNSKT